MKTSVGTKATEGQETAKKPNEFVFEQIQFGGSTRTTIMVNDEDIVIKKVKINDEKKTEKPKGEVTIKRSAIASIKIQRTFDPTIVLVGAVTGAIIGFILFGGVIAILLFTAIFFVFAFPKKMTVVRKDGTKYKTKMSYEDEEYERFINYIF